MTHETVGPYNEIQPQGAPIVYLVDDDPSFLRALSRRLRAADYEINMTEAIPRRPQSNNAS